MKLKKFIQKLKELERAEGGEIEVVMADNIPVVVPIFSTKHSSRKVIISDEA